MTPSHSLRARPAAAACLALVIAAAACAPPSQQDMQTAQALTELGESYNDLRLTQQELQDQFDSLKAVVAQQDTVIRTLANLAGVQPPR
jgi:septal ring factor EnvC (AmiA/AmiB activator)